ncbi:hypothetical protein NPIL_161761 [Nephila pilipes]|uniref:Uncharacterized protein n=1 Tax=Nephila pilipes TaxID=299642 RepID=A0A8X6N6A2_NEPPI|nr:hypothetical protein NPIL_161761 [Nephila pilipes]
MDQSQVHSAIVLMMISCDLTQYHLMSQVKEISLLEQKSIKAAEAFGYAHTPKVLLPSRKTTLSMPCTIRRSRRKNLKLTSNPKIVETPWILEASALSQRAEHGLLGTFTSPLILTQARFPDCQQEL